MMRRTKGSPVGELSAKLTEGFSDPITSVNPSVAFGATSPAGEAYLLDKLEFGAAMPLVMAIA